MKPSNLALLPCPFCCGKAAFVIGMKQTVRTVDVICQDCGGAMPAFCEDDAAADWNIRPAPSSVSTPAQDATVLADRIELAKVALITEGRDEDGEYETLEALAAAVAIALQQSPATDGAGFSHTRPDGKGAAQ